MNRAALVSPKLLIALRPFTSVAITAGSPAIAVIHNMLISVGMIRWSTAKHRGEGGATLNSVHAKKTKYTKYTVRAIIGKA